MNKQTLGGLAKNYAKGVIDKEVYRKSRSELIKAIVAGKIAVEAINYKEPFKPSSETEEAITEGIKRNKTTITAPKRSISPSIKQNADTNKNKFPFVFILISAIIVLSLILAEILFYPEPPAPTLVTEISKPIVTTSKKTNKKTNVENADTHRSAAAESLIGHFLSTKNWNDDSLDKFIQSWSALTQQEKEAAAETKRMQRMKMSIYKQFLESKVLIDIDSEKAIVKQQKLIDFANAIGIEDPRLVIK